ncbi:MAG TPA: SRPBCC family protein [Terriglobales bacterium]|nr:SRPBCC family protein [Terriglobales bacterium]
MIGRHIYTLQRRQWLPRTLHETFEFFERPQNLPLITPPWLGFRILTPEPITMARGLTVDYEVRVMGMRTHWRSLISEYDPPHSFRDVQVIGVYRLWDHRHRFWRENGGTVIEDFVVYEPPFGPLGALMNRLLIDRQLHDIFEYRGRRIEELLLGDAVRRGHKAGGEEDAA